MRWLIGGKFRGVAAKVGDFTSIAMFRGGRRQISGVLIRKTNIDTERQSTTTTRWEGRQTTALGIPEQPLC